MPFLVLGVPLAHAFCGTFVGGTDSALINHSSQVVLVRSEGHTALTVAADFSGDAEDFGLLIPVPEVLTADDVHVVDPALLQRLDQYSTPRAVTYSCTDFVSSGRSDDLNDSFLGCAMPTADYNMTAKEDGAYDSGGAGDGPPADSSVKVESSFGVANYDIVVLSAEESGDLFSWLNTNGYAVPAGGQDILQEYIDGGALFLAAKVHLEPDGTEQTWLPPLQFEYDAETFTLPIKIGTISAEAEQEVVIFAITDADEVGIANYDQKTVEDECMYSGDLGEHYKAAVDAAFADGPGWILEHSWPLGQQCDPCTGTDPFTVEEMRDFGYDNADTGHYGSNLGYLTRLRLRYAPEDVTADVSLYGTGFQEQEQTRYIEYKAELESMFPVCGEGMVDDPGTCEDWLVEQGGDSGAGCASTDRDARVGALLGALFATGLSFSALRRRA